MSVIVLPRLKKHINSSGMNDAKFRARHDFVISKVKEALTNLGVKYDVVHKGKLEVPRDLDEYSEHGVMLDDNEAVVLCERLNCHGKLLNAYFHVKVARRCKGGENSLIGLVAALNERTPVVDFNGSYHPYMPTNLTPEWLWKNGEPKDRGACWFVDEKYCAIDVESFVAQFLENIKYLKQASEDFSRDSFKADVILRTVASKIDEMTENVNENGGILGMKFEKEQNDRRNEGGWVLKAGDRKIFKIEVIKGLDDNIVEFGYYSYSDIPGNFTMNVDLKPESYIPDILDSIDRIPAALEAVFGIWKLQFDFLEP